jgi:hypothetical protein
MFKAALSLGALLNVSLERAVNLVQGISRKNTLKTSNLRQRKTSELLFATKKAADIFRLARAEMAAHYAQIKTLVEHPK